MEHIDRIKLGKMVILDTNVMSRIVDGPPDDELADLLMLLPLVCLYITVLTEAELWHWAYSRKDERERSRLIVAVGLALGSFAGRILPFDRAAALEYAKIAAMRGDKGSRRPVIDIQIAAIASVHNCAIVTRNAEDFAKMNVEHINPWRVGGGPSANRKSHQ